MDDFRIDISREVTEALGALELPMAVLCWYAELLYDHGYAVEYGHQEATEITKYHHCPPVRQQVGTDAIYLRWRRPGERRWIGRMIIGPDFLRLTPLRSLPRGFPEAIEHADPVGYERLERAVLKLGERR